MHSHFVNFITICLLSAVVADDCQNYKFLVEQKGCTFSMNKCQKGMQFKFCQTKENSTIIQLNLCIVNCCTSHVENLSSNQNIQQCQGLSEKKGKQQFSLFILILIYLSPVALACLAIAILCSIKVIFDFLTKKRSIINQNNNLGSNPIQAKSEQQLIFSGQKWIAEHEVITDTTILTSQEICTICLDNNTDIITDCNHKYHIKCLFTWLNKQNYCPLCHQLNLKHFKFFCHKCHKSHFDTDIILSYCDDKMVRESEQYVCFKCKFSQKRQNNF